MFDSNMRDKSAECIRAAFAASLSIALSTSLYAADNLPAPLFADRGILEINIVAPMKTLMDVRPDKSYLDGTLAYTQQDGTERRLAIKLRTRGNYRRDKEHCDFAPIRLNFSKPEVAGTLFDGQDKLKLVTQCKTGDGAYAKVVLREYLAYRLFQQLSDVSYGVRLLRIKYVDSDGGAGITRYGFVIEGEADVAQRNALQPVKAERLSAEEHDPARQNLVHLFEFMIGNTEYSLVNPEPDKSCCHNADILSATGGPPYVALPFDFDFAGLVNAPYAEPNPRYPISSVRIRFYRGLCANNTLLPGTIDLFERKRDDVFRAIDELAGTSSSARRTLRWSRNYVDAFYYVIEDPDRVQQELLDKCYDPAVVQ
jgi:hypothetical protein